MIISQFTIYLHYGLSENHEPEYANLYLHSIEAVGLCSVPICQID